MNEKQAEEELEPTLWIGIDVAKGSFTAAARFILEKGLVRPQQDLFTNNRSGVRKLCKWIDELEKKFCGRTGVAMEATGTYSLRLYENLVKERPGLYVFLCNPYKISFFMRSVSINKTDEIDAGLIAGYASCMRPPRYREPTPDQKALRELTRERAFYVEIRTQYRNHLESLTDSSARARLKKAMESTDEIIKDLDSRIHEYMSGRASEECRHEIELMKTMPGVAETSAAIIYGELGSLAGYTRKQLSAMSGVCPTIKQSGESQRSGKLSKRGSKYLRRILFLDARQAILRSPAMAEFHQRILAKDNSSKMTAKTACMRKLLLVLRGIVVSGTPFDPKHVSKKPEVSNKKEQNTDKLIQTT